MPCIVIPNVYTTPLLNTKVNKDDNFHESESWQIRQTNIHKCRVSMHLILDIIYKVGIKILYKFLLDLPSNKIPKLDMNTYLLDYRDALLTKLCLNILRINIQKNEYVNHIKS